MLSLTDAPTNISGKILFHLDTEAVEVIQHLLDNLIIHRIVPLLKTKCSVQVDESCALKVLLGLPWPEQQQKAVADDISTSWNGFYSVHKNSNIC